MADSKGTISDSDAAGRLGIMLFVLAIIAFAAARFGSFVTNATSGEAGILGFIPLLLDRFSIFVDWFYELRVPFIIISAIICCAAIALLIHSNKNLKKIRKKFDEEMTLLEAKLAGEALSNKNARWERVETLANSESPGDWRVAVIEADIMLDDLTTSMRYHGDTLGEKLKSIEKSDFTTLDLAWEAHKTRNRIAHQGSNYILTSRETKRVIDLYRQVFEEFDYI